MPRVVTANELRWLGEEADGKRGVEYEVVWKKKDGKEVLGLVEKGHRAKDEIPTDILVTTPHEGGGLRGDTKIFLQHEGTMVEVEGADCVFITQSSFAKFVIPYYTRFRSPSQIAAMKYKYFNDDFIGVAHLPPSEDEGIEAEDAAGPGAPAGPGPKNLCPVTKSGSIVTLSSF